MRKLILEMIHRLPLSEIVRPHVRSILALMLKLLKTDNEDNVLVCLRIIIDIHKQYRPAFHPEVIFNQTLNHSEKSLLRSFLFHLDSTFHQLCEKYLLRTTE